MRNSKRSSLQFFFAFLVFGTLSCYAGTVKLIESCENVNLFHPIVRIIAGGFMCGVGMAGLISFAFRHRADQSTPREHVSPGEI
jgi:hypothetical protein